MLRRCAVPGLLAAVLLLATAGPAGAAPLLPGENALVSIPSGFGALPSTDVSDSYVWPEGVSDDGCRIAFRSGADGLVADDDNRYLGIYVRDRCTAVPTTTLVSRGSGAAGAAANGTSSGAAISGDGALVAFRSNATNLTTASANPTADVNGSSEDIFVRDLSTNALYYVSRLAGLGGAGTAAITDSNPSVTRAGGQILVTFDSYTDLLVPGDTNGTRDVFLRNVSAGTIIRVNVKDGTAATQANGFARNGVISEDGQWVAFDANATDMNALDTNAIRDIYVRNVAGTNATLLASHTAANAPSSGGDSTLPAIDADGTVVAWASSATNLSAADTNNRSDIYLATRVATTFGAATLISRADSAAGAVGDDGSGSPSLDDTGARVGFRSDATNLAAGDANAAQDAYLRIRATNDTVLLSGNADGATGGAAATLSGDGLLAAFAQQGSALTADADQSASSIVMRTAAASPGPAELVSRPTGTGPFQGGVGQSFFDQTTSISPDGRFVLFASASPALFPGPGNHVYVRDTLLGTTTLVDRADGVVGAVATPGSFAVPKSISAGGTRVAFHSDAASLVAGDDNGRDDLFVRDLAAGTTTRIGRRSDGTFPGGDYDSRAVLSGDGHQLAFEVGYDLLPIDTGNDGDVYVQDLGSGAIALVSRGAGDGAQSPDGGYSPSIDAGGSRIAFSTQANLAAPGQDTNASSDVYVRDMVSGELLLASRPAGASAPTLTGGSYGPSLSGSGAQVVFTSAADLVGAGTAVNHLFLRDLTAATTTLVDRADGAAGSPADAEGYAATLSSDGTRVGFLSSADNLGAGPQTRTQGYVRDVAAGTTILATRAPGLAGAIAADGANNFQISAEANCAVMGSTSPGLIPGVTQSDFALIVLRGLSRECPADPPQTSITSGPSGLTNDRRPAFGLAASEAATFSCRIDGGAAGACASGFRPATLGDGGHTLSVAATDAAGYTDATPAMRTFSVDGTAPVISRLTASPSRFSVSTRRRRAKRSKAPKLGSSLSFRLSEPAAATVTVLRELPGRKSGRRCLAPRKGVRIKRSARCTRTVQVGVVKLAKGRVGTNTVELTRRFGKGTLKPGAHRVAVDAHDAAGNAALRRTLRVTVLAPRRR